MNSLYRQLNQVRDSFWDPGAKMLYEDVFNVDWSDIIHAIAQGESGQAGRSIQMDITSDESEVRIVADVPGFTKDELTVDVHDHELTISGKKKVEESEEGAESQKSVEIYKKVRLADELDIDKADLRLEHGQLVIVIPKSEASKPKQLPIS